MAAVCRDWDEVGGRDGGGKVTHSLVIKFSLY